MRHSTPGHAFSANPDYDYEIRCAIGHTAAGVGSVGEILAAVASVSKSDHEGWYQAWWDLGERALATARDASTAGHRVSAAERFISASAYYGNAVNAVSALADEDRLSPTFTRQEDAWNGFIEHTDAHVETVAIPYEGGTLPGWFFRSATPTGRTLIAVNGSDGSRASLWSTCIDAAMRRGYHVLVFDGPGQQSQLFTDGVPFRFDWEHVLTPVFDCVSRLDGVDASRIGVYGISQGGYWVARALAFEHRCAAAITDPGVVDVSTSWTDHIPAHLLKLLDAGDAQKFDAQMALGMKLSPGTARTWRFRARPYGTSGYADTIAAVRRYSVRDVADRITTPLLVLSPEDEQFWPGQAEQLAALAPRVSTIVPFAAAEGASGHCQPLARPETAQRMFDWLDDQLSS